jgi:hypothetical protein
MTRTASAEKREVTYLKRKRRKLGWYVIVNGEQAAWSISKTIAKQKAATLGGTIEREKP